MIYFFEFQKLGLDFDIEEIEKLFVQKIKKKIIQSKAGFENTLEQC